MTNSDKNFVTVRDYLANGVVCDTIYTFCLLYHYNAPVEYGDDRQCYAEGVLRRFRKSVASAQNAARNALCGGDSGDLATRCARTANVLDAVERARGAVEEALVDGFDTTRVFLR